MRRENRSGRGIPLPTLAELRAAFIYDERTGNLIRRVRKGRGAPGAIVGTLHPEGYLIVPWTNCDGKFRGIRAHRIVWMLHHRRWPTALLDHKNGVKSDNRIANLREVDNSGNSQNAKPVKNSTGFPGVRRRSGCSGFDSAVRIKGVRHHLGSFPTAKAAYTAYLKAKRVLHPFWNPSRFKACRALPT